MSDGPVELESQVVLRLPPVPAGILRDVLRNSPSTLKDRLKIKLDPDMRHGTLFFDHYVLQAKLVDLPCIIESHKTIEKKHIYKTADICQMLICSFEDEVEDEKPQNKKKESIKFDKKYLWPHGITPPLKNVRKRRFRKTLKKKQYSDQPELEKEVRRLLRTDYEAVQITWEVIDEEEQNVGDPAAKSLMQGSKTNEEPTPSGSANRLAVEEIFGEDLSDSDMDEDTLGNNADDESRLSADSEEESDSRASFSQDTKDSSPNKKSSQVTSFSAEMFSGDDSSDSSPPPTTSRKSGAAGTSVRRESKPNYNRMSKSELRDQLEALKSHLTEISARCMIQEADLASVDNFGLRQRLQGVVDKLVADQDDKRTEIEMVQNLLECGDH